MGNANDLFKIDQIEVDFKDFEKIRLKATQNSTVILSFLVYNYNTPVDLSQYNYEVRFSLPNGYLYSEEDNVAVNGNILTVTCDSTLTQAIGEATGTLRLWTSDGKQTSLYKLVIRVYGTGTGEIISKSTISALEHLDLSINRAIELSRSFDEDMKTIVEASEKANELIKTLSDANNDLKKTIDNGTAKNTELTNKINEAKTESTNFTKEVAENKTKIDLYKAQLDDKFVTADKYKLDLDTKNNLAQQNEDLLDAKNTRAETNKTNLDTANATANELLQRFKDYDTSDLVIKNQTMLRELICNKELCILNHSYRGTKFPIIQLLYYSNGFGMGGFGEGLAGGTSPSCNLMQSKITYIDDKNIKIEVPEGYYISDIKINKHSDSEYLLTSNIVDDARCILVLFK